MASKLPTGSLPPRLVYVYSAALNATEDETTPDGPAIKWQAAEVIDVTRTKPIQTAQRRMGKSLLWETDNRPIESFELLFHHSYKKSSEFHVRVLDRFKVEITESSFVDFLRHGRLVNGKMLGPFVWGTYKGRGMQLIRVGSVIYEELVEAMERKGGKAINARELEVGGVYAFWDKRKILYLGRVDYEVMDWNGKTTPTRKDHAWLSVPDDGADPLLTQHWTHNIQTHEKIRVVEKVGEFPVPADWYERVQKAQVRSVLDAESRHDPNARPHYGGTPNGPFKPEDHFWKSMVKPSSIRPAGTAFQKVEVPERYQYAYDRMCAEILNAKLPEKPKEAK